MARQRRVTDTRLTLAFAVQEPGSPGRFGVEKSHEQMRMFIDSLVFSGGGGHAGGSAQEAVGQSKAHGTAEDIAVSCSMQRLSGFHCPSSQGFATPSPKPCQEQQGARCPCLGQVLLDAARKLAS